MEYHVVYYILDSTPLSLLRSVYPLLLIPLERGQYRSQLSQQARARAPLCQVQYTSKGTKGRGYGEVGVIYTVMCTRVCIGEMITTHKTAMGARVISQVGWTSKGVIASTTTLFRARVLSHTRDLSGYMEGGRWVIRGGGLPINCEVIYTCLTLLFIILSKNHIADFAKILHCGTTSIAKGTSNKPPP